MTLVTATLPDLAIPSLAARQAIQEGPVEHEAFLAAFAATPALHAIEQRAAARPQPMPEGSARIAFWNAERLKYGPASAALLGGLGADVLLLCEVDLGMARSQNRHTTRDLADALGAGYLFGAEFVELGLGDARERAWHAAETNALGLHGGAILAHCPLRRPALIRLETSGRWFDGSFGERRVGGRIALAAEIAIAGQRVLLVSAHYESHSDQPDRVAQTVAMLDAIDAHAPGLPVLIAGDFNTSSFDFHQKRDPAFVARSLDQDPRRLVHPVSHEPMFDTLAGRGYDWEACNTMGVGTQRMRPDGTPRPPYGRIDWLFSRGLTCSDPATIPAIDHEGTAISDHEVLAVTIRPA